MPVRRAILMIGAVFPILLLIVLLRAETTRLEYRLSQYDRRAVLLLDELRESEVVLERLRDPQRIRNLIASARLAEVVGEPGSADASPREPEPGAAPRSGKPRPPRKP